MDYLSVERFWDLHMKNAMEVLVMLLDLRYGYILSTIQVLYALCIPVKFFVLVWWCHGMFHNQPVCTLRKIFSLVEVLLSWKFRREEYKGKKKKILLFSWLKLRM